MNEHGDMRQDLSELFGSGRRARDLDDLTLVASNLKQEWPRPRPEREESAGERKTNLLAMHREIYGEDAAPDTVRRVGRFLTPVAIGGTLLICVILTACFSLWFRPAGKEIGEIRVQAGQVTIISNDGSSRQVNDRSEIREDEEIDSGRETLAEVRLSNGTVARIGNNSTVTLPNASDELTGIKLDRGQCYLQAKSGTIIALKTSEGSFSTEGGAMNVDGKPGTSSCVAIRDDALAIYDPGRLVIGEGELVRLSGGEKRAVSVSGLEKVTGEDLDTDWFRYNVAMDRLEGFDSGILDGLPEENVEELLQDIVPPTAINPEGIPDEVAPAPEAQPEDGPQDPQPEPVQPPEPEEPASVSLSASRSGNQVNLTWSATGTGGCQGYSILRVVDTGTPEYPANTYADIGGTTTTGFADSRVYQGPVYYYRVALLKDGGVKAYSNVTPVGGADTSSSALPVAFRQPQAVGGHPELDALQ